MVGGRIVTIVGQSGSGKSTQVGELARTPGFKICRNITTRDPRPTDLPGEYDYLSNLDYNRLRIRGRLLWDISLGYGVRYAKDRRVVDAALADSDAISAHALVPEKADFLVRRYGAQVIKTVLLPSPGDATLLERMVGRGDSAVAAAERLANEKEADWQAQALAIEGIYVVTAHDILGRHEEILDYATS